MVGRELNMLYLNDASEFCLFRPDVFGDIVADEIRLGKAVCLINRCLNAVEFTRLLPT